MSDYAKKVPRHGKHYGACPQLKLGAGHCLMRRRDQEKVENIYSTYHRINVQVAEPARRSARQLVRRAGSGDVNR